MICKQYVIFLYLYPQQVKYILAGKYFQSVSKMFCVRKDFILRTKRFYFAYEKIFFTADTFYR